MVWVSSSRDCRAIVPPSVSNAGIPDPIGLSLDVDLSALHSAGLHACRLSYGTPPATWPQGKTRT